MNRPRYESPKDILAEQNFSMKMKELKGVSLCKLSEVKYVIDFAVYDGENNVVGFIEFRRRYNNADKYPTVFCSVTKWMKLIEFYKYRWAAFFVQFDDKLLYIKPDSIDYEITISGRTDRDDEFDMEPNILLPVSEFKELKAYNKTI